MTKEEKELITQIVREHPLRMFFDGKRKSDYVPSAREALEICRNFQVKKGETDND